ncbi:hypothetical protein KW790_02900 [Candidatus Parcubacteria bacterium]|nr:hypothetical protein [Candidatus Parcubacteria bacterium]
MKSVSLIFGNEAKVKMMRLFVFNPHEAFDTQTIIDRVKEKPKLVKSEINNLLKANLIKRKSYVKQLKGRPGSAPKAISKKVKGFILNPLYPYLAALAHFLIDAAPISKKEIMEKVGKAGNIKLLLISGLFMHDPEARVDLLVVGDHIRQGTLLNNISYIEAELGKEIRYAAFETPDFQYRLGIYDKLVRDILDYPHQKLLNKLGI